METVLVLEENEKAIEFFKRLTPAKRMAWKKNYEALLKDSNISHMHPTYTKGLEVITALMLELEDIK